MKKYVIIYKENGIRQIDYAGFIKRLLLRIRYKIDTIK